MAEIRVPTLGESVTEATIGKWFKKPGDAVAVDEPLVELETDKVTIEVPAPAAGVLADIAAKDGETVAVGALLGQIKEGAGAPPRSPPPAGGRPAAKAAEAGRSRAPLPRRAADMPLAPSVRKMAAETGVDPAKVAGSGKDGRVTKGDMMAAIERAAAQPTPVPQTAAAGPRAVAGRRCRARGAREDDAAAPDHRAAAEGGAEHRRHAHDLQRGRHERGDGDAQPVQGSVREEARRQARLHGLLRARLRAGAEGNSRRQRRDRRHRPRSTRTTTTSASRSAPRRAWWCRWCATPISKSLAEIEKTIADFGKRARDGALKIEEMQGGTFTITNGGVYGSLMSTPILNAPQSGILGMHKIQERPVVVAGKIEMRPMMYLALSYDHRIVDGREAVTFLVRVKEVLEDPADWC